MFPNNNTVLIQWFVETAKSTKMHTVKTLTVDEVCIELSHPQVIMSHSPIHRSVEERDSVQDSLKCDQSF